MSKHKFATGDRVRLLPDRGNANLRPGIYTITWRMPETSEGCQYRAKSVMDNHERVLNEAQIRPE